MLFVEREKKLIKYEYSEPVCSFHLRASTLRFERLSKTKFVIKAVIYMQDRDQFELTKNLTPAQFKKENQFDDEWFGRISRYDHVDHGQIYEEDLPHQSQLIFETCIKNVKGRRMAGGFDGDNRQYQTSIRRDFSITVYFSQDELNLDIPFF